MSTTDMFDAIQRPAHYASGDVECIDAIKASMSDIEYLGYCKGNVMKYLWRYRNSGSLNSSYIFPSESAFGSGRGRSVLLSIWKDFTIIVFSPT